MVHIDTLTAPQNYINRELSWLEFNGRVLREAANAHNPILERLKFLSIVSTNLDEFFMIRVASLRDQVAAGYDRPDASGMTPAEQVTAIARVAHRMVARQYAVLHRVLMPKLREMGMCVLKPENLTSAQRAEMTLYFEHNVYPVLTPMAVDSSRPFPLIQSRSLNIAVLIEGEEEGEERFATVQIPSMMTRIVQIGGSLRSYMLLEDVVLMHIDRLFKGHKVLATTVYRITRNADLAIDEEDAVDLLMEIEKSIKMRRWGAVIRVEIDEGADARLREMLMDALEVGEEEMYNIKGPVNLDFLMRVYNLPGFMKLKYHPFSPRMPEWMDSERSIFDVIREGDRLLHVPYDSFEPVIRLVREAASDPKVLAIKQTLYRVSGNSPVVRALSDAAEAGKQVTALLEVKARFDEENNIQWGKQLERAGCHVIYGVHGLKTHAKITLVVRQEEEGIRRYVHLATGNYNDVTARLYTDHSLFTADEQFGSDATAFFNMLTGFSEAPAFNHLIMAPNDMRWRVLQMIKREIRCAEQGGTGEIFAKMNSLVDEHIIRALYEASAAGVRVRLIVRGICCLRPGIEGVSANIRVRSIVGRYLEHSRIFMFGNNGHEEVYLSSADWMPRNLDRRVELLFPIKEAALRAHLKWEMEVQWRDNAKARELTPGGWYTIAETGTAEPLNAQEHFMALSESGM